MRNIRARRYFRMLLLPLFIVCLVLFTEDRIDAFVPQLKGMIEARLGEMVNERFVFSVGSFEGGIINPLTVSDIKIRDKKGGDLFSSITINNIRTNFRLWDAIWHWGESSFMAKVFSTEAYAYVYFVTKSKDASGFLRVETAPAVIKARGYVDVPVAGRLDVSGVLSEDAFVIEARPAHGTVKVEGTLSPGGDLAITFKANHILISGFDVICDGTMTNRIVTDSGSKSKYVTGEFSTKHFIVNYSPFPDVSATYHITDKTAVVSRLTIGDNIKAQGTVSLIKPYPVNCGVTFNNMNIARFIASLGVKELSNIGGVLNGKVEATGPVDNLKTKSRIEVRQGVFSVLNFDYLNATFRTEGPFLRIEDATITRESGQVSLEGEMDLRRIGKAIIFQDLRVVNGDTAMTWDKFATTDRQGVKEVTMQRTLDGAFKVGAKKYVDEEKIDESQRDKDEVRFEYKLHPEDSLQMIVGEDKRFLGLQHKEKF